MLVVNTCPSEGDLFPCTDDLQMAFSVVLNRDVDSASVSTQFYTATGQLCAGATAASVSLTAGTPVTLTVPTVYLSLQGSSTSPECALPLKTTRIVAHLLHVNTSRGGDLVTQEFSKTYTFIHP
jgi:hypothetical protein